MKKFLELIDKNITWREITVTIVFVFVLCLFVSSCRSQTIAEECPGGICPVPQQTVVSLESVLRVRSVEPSRGNRTAISYGSGTVVCWGNVTVFLTAEHVVRSAPDNVSVRINGQWHGIGRIHVDRSSDFALYQAPDHVPALPFGVAELHQGTPLYVVGFGGNGQKCRTTAYFNRMARNDIMILDGAVISGDSGGPILSTGGIVIGNVFAIDNRNSSYAVHGRRIAAAMEALARQVSADLPEGIELCQYYETDPTGCFGNRCPQPNRGTPLTPGYRAPVPDPSITLRPPSVPVLPATTPPVTVNIPQDTAVVAGWLNDLSGKVDNQAQRIEATEQAVGAAIGQAAEIVRTTNGRLTSLETATMLAERDREKLPETIATVANEQIKSHYPTICLLAVGICVGVLLVRRWLDRRDGVVDGVVDFQGLYQRRRALRDARDGTIDYEYPVGYSPTDRYYGRPSDLARSAPPVVVVPQTPATSQTPAAT